MRIDLTRPAISEMDRIPSATSGSKTQDVTNRLTVSTEDVAHLSTGTDAVQNLKTQLDKVPEIRQQQVDSLKTAIAKGNYRIDPQRIAAAMLDDGALDLD